MVKQKPPRFDFSDSDLDKEAPVAFFASDSQRSQLFSLERYVTRREQNVVTISGPPGFGKTALVKQFQVNLNRSKRYSFKFEWVVMPRLQNPSETVDALINKLRQDKSDDRIVIVLDEVEEIDLRQLRFFVSRLLNWKRVKSVIIVTNGTPPNIARAFNIIIAPPDGKLYGLREQVIVTRKPIISSVAPLIVTASDALIEKLKREPAGLFKISPRQFEEVIAELLTGMGMEVELTPETRDGGKDILAYMKTELGRILCLVEAKQYDEKRPVGVSLIRTLYGTVIDHQATTGMLVTTSRFAKPAKQFQERHKYQLTLKEYEDVVGWLLKHRRK